MMSLDNSEWCKYYYDSISGVKHTNKSTLDNDNQELKGKHLPYFWHFQGLKKNGKCKQSWWEIAQYGHSGKEIIVGIASHKNPRRHGQSILFYDKDSGVKLGFMLIKNSAVVHQKGQAKTLNTYTSTLIGMFIDPSYRKHGLSNTFMSIWLSLCTAFHAIPNSEMINKPLLALMLDKYGFTADSGGIEVEISPLKHNKHLYTDLDDCSEEKVVLYANNLSLEGSFSHGELKGQNLIISNRPPHPRGRVVQVKTSYHYHGGINCSDSNLILSAPHKTIEHALFGIIHER